MQVLTGLIATGSKSEEIFERLGDAYYGLSGRSGPDRAECLRKALADYGQAVALCANSYRPRRGRARVLRELGRIPDAFEDLQVAYALNPADSWVLSDFWSNVRQFDS